MIPVYKLEVYHDDTLLYTITDEAEHIHIRDILTSEVGTFSFSVPTVKGTSLSGYQFNDISVHDKVKFWLGYDAVSDNPLFVGRISRIHAPLALSSGYTRIFEGKLLGEILERTIKPYTYWLNVDASVIVTELATELGLGVGQIETDTTDVTLITEGETYFDVLARVSDHWVSGDVQVKKDFHVDINNNLVWKSRPLRSTTVETLTIGSNISDYYVLHDVLKVKNNITVYGVMGQVGVPGEEGRMEPTDGDAWTQGLSGWTAIYGDLFNPIDWVKVGSNSIRCEFDTSYRGKFKRNLSVILVGQGKYQTLNFWICRNYGTGFPLTTKEILLYAPDSSNYFKAQINIDGSSNWYFNQISLGENQEWDVNRNPNGPWTKIGSPRWDKVSALYFNFVSSSGQDIIWLDGLYFGHGRWRYAADDLTSQTKYGLRQARYIDDILRSDSDCEKRVKTRLYQEGNPVTRIDITTTGNANIKIGDRLSLSIPAEAITTASFDVVAVEQDMTKQEFKTKLSAVGSALTRQLPPANPLESIAYHTRLNRVVARGQLFTR